MKETKTYPLFENIWGELILENQSMAWRKESFVKTKYLEAERGCGVGL